MIVCHDRKSPEFYHIFMTTGSGVEKFIYLLLLHAMYLATIDLTITLPLSCQLFSLNCNGLLS